MGRTDEPMEWEVDMSPMDDLLVLLRAWCEDNSLAVVTVVLANDSGEPLELEPIVILPVGSGEAGKNALQLAEGLKEGYESTGKFVAHLDKRGCP
jgi:hypothetical protein